MVGKHCFNATGAHVTRIFFFFHLTLSLHSSWLWRIHRNKNTDRDTTVSGNDFQTDVPIPTSSGTLSNKRTICLKVIWKGHMNKHNFVDRDNRNLENINKSLSLRAYTTQPISGTIFVQNGSHRNIRLYIFLNNSKPKPLWPSDIFQITGPS